MTTTISGTNGIDKVAPGAVETADLPAGTVLQVVNATYATQVTNSSSTFADTGLTATITPTSATSKILIMTAHHGNLVTPSNNGINWRLMKNGVQLQYVEDLSPFSTASGVNTGSTSCVINYLDSPATTSAITYKTQFASRANLSAAATQWNGVGQSTSYITLMEIAA